MFKVPLGQGLRMECSSVYTPLSPVYPETSTVLSNSVLLLNACTEWKKLNQTVEGFHNMALLYLFNHILLFWLNLLFLVEVAGSLSDCESYLSFKFSSKPSLPSISNRSHSTCLPYFCPAFIINHFAGLIYYFCR